MDTLPGTVQAPVPKVGIHRLPRRQIMRQHPPLTPAAHHIQDRINNLTATMFRWTATSLHRWDNRFQALPFFISQVCWIPLPLLHAADETWRAEGEVEEPAIAGRRPGEAGDASRRKVIVEAVSHRVGVRRGGRRTNRGVITCRVMRVHFGVTMAEMHHEHSDTPVTGAKQGSGREVHRGSPG